MATLLLLSAVSVGAYFFVAEYWLVRQEQVMERAADRRADHEAQLLEREAQLKERAAEREAQLKEIAAEREAEREETKKASEE